MKLKLKYGRDGLDVDLKGNGITIFRTGEMPTLQERAAGIRDRLEKPIQSPPLRDIARNKRNACIVISDITRPAPNRTLLPPVIDTLEQAGIPRERIRILIATGIHRSPIKSELREMLGEHIPAAHPIISHDARNPSTMSRLGYTSRGTPIDINRTYLESEIKIVVSLVEPHFMAGYSGGRKSVAIGLTSVDAVRKLHGTELLEHPGSRNCELARNPLHAELTEIATAAGIDFCINAVIDAERRIGGIFAGDFRASHKHACDFAARYCTVRTAELFDVALTTAAGYPLDSTYYQAVKGLVGALDILRPGGSIILAAECSQGLGSAEFVHMLEKLALLSSYDEFLTHISNPLNFVIDQWEVEMLIKALRKGNIYLFSTGIPNDAWHLTFAAKIHDVADAVSLALGGTAREGRIAVIPEGPYVIPLCDTMSERDEISPV